MNIRSVGFTFLLSLLTLSTLFGQSESRTYQTQRIVEAPKIDGKLNDASWAFADFSISDFITERQKFGEPSSEQTEVAVVYDDEAIYVAARCLTKDASTILSEFRQRDGIGANADLFGFFIDTYQSGLNAVAFYVLSNGVQCDAQISPSNFDFSWNAVWNSGVSQDENGWYAEMRIPYSALRFPNSDTQTWSINFRRRIRSQRERANWNPVDPNINGLVNQFGTLTGIENISPPTRLAFTPYVSVTGINDQSNNEGWQSNFRGGMDLKVGLNESYTLDMILIPDFGQVISDQQVLNLGFQEIEFQERRQFFIEGTDLFRRADLFYSRRIGRTPGKFYDIEDNLAEGEEIVENPAETSLINGLKVSGRGNNGLAIGLFNAVTAQSSATVKGIDGEDYEIETEPLSNYNVMVLDQNLANNSFVSLINTNVNRAGDSQDANVLGTEFQLRNTKNTVQLSGDLSYSRVKENEASAMTEGLRYEVEIEKIGGKWGYGYRNALVSDDYDNNDMGFFFTKNRMLHRLGGTYSLFEPKGKIQSARAEVGLTLRHRLSGEFESLESRGFGRITWNNFNSTGMFYEVGFSEGRDYYEPREEERYNITFPFYAVNFWFSPDYRKKYLADFNFGFWNAKRENLKGIWWGFRPRLRFSDRFNVRYGLSQDLNANDLGYIDSDDENIYYAERRVNTIVNDITGNFIFNARMSISLVGRYYMSQVQNISFFTLNDDGTFEPGAELDNPGETFGAFSSDLIYSYEFLPGSWLTAAWKWNSTLSDDPQLNYGPSFRRTVNQDPLNRFSLKLLYYLDYQDAKKLFKRKV